MLLWSRRAFLLYFSNLKMHPIQSLTYTAINHMWLHNYCTTLILLLLLPPVNFEPLLCIPVKFSFSSTSFAPTAWGLISGSEEVPVQWTKFQVVKITWFLDHGWRNTWKCFKVLGTNQTYELCNASDSWSCHDQFNSILYFTLWIRFTGSTGK